METMVKASFIVIVTSILMFVDYSVGYNHAPAFLKRGPMMTVQPLDTVVLDEGRDHVILEGAATGNPTPTFQWYKGTVYGGVLDFDTATYINPERDPRYTLTGGRLTISLPTARIDTGEYQCKAINEYGTILSNPARLTFGALGQFPNIVPSVAEAAANLGFQLECPPIRFYPAVRYQWAKSTLQNWIQTSVDDHIFISSNGKLYFSRVTSVDEDIYYCSATLTSPGQLGNSSVINNIQSAISRPVALKVVQQSGGIVPPAIQNEFPLTFPRLPLIGQLVEVECFAYGTGTLQYTWTRKDGKQLPSSTRFRDHKRVMELHNVSVDDSGIYNCEVSSTETNVSDNKNISINIESRPLFTVPLENQFVDEGNNVSWHCQAAGSREPTYRWYINGVPVPGSSVVPGIDGVTAQGDVLTIQGVRARQHSGMYQCSATNQHGTSYSSAELRVTSLSKAECPSKETLIQHAEDCLSEIRFYRGMGMTVGLEETAVYACIVWQKDSTNQGVNSINNSTSNEAYKDALSCLQSMFDECINKTDVIEVLEKLFNITRANEDYEYICSDLQVFMDNTECIANADLKAKPCIEAETNRYEKERHEKTRSGEITNDIETDFPSLCKWVMNLVECSNDAYADQVCGGDVESMRIHLMSLVIPPVCNYWSTNASSLSTETATWSTKAATWSTDAATLSTKTTIWSTKAATLSTEAVTLLTKAATLSTEGVTLSTEAATWSTEAATWSTNSTNATYWLIKAASWSTKANTSAIMLLALIASIFMKH